MSYRRGSRTSTATTTVRRNSSGCRYSTPSRQSRIVRARKVQSSSSDPISRLSGLFSRRFSVSWVKARGRKAGYDIADYLLKVETKESVLSRMIARNPHLEMLISTLDLEVVSIDRHPWNSTEKREFQTLIRKAEIYLFSVEQVYVGVLHFPTTCSPERQVRLFPMITKINIKNTTENGKEKYDYSPTLGWTIR